MGDLFNTDAPFSVAFIVYKNGEVSSEATRLTFDGVSDAITDEPWTHISWGGGGHVGPAHRDANEDDGEVVDR